MHHSLDRRWFLFSVPPIAAIALLTLGVFAPLGPAAQTPKGPLVPDDVTFEAGIEYTNPDGQHLQLNMARPKAGDGPFPAVVCIHGGGFRAGTREGYDVQCIRLAQRGYVAM